MARERRARLFDALESCDIDVLAASDCNEGRRMLETQPPVHVVVTDTTLPDGDWRRVLEIVERGYSKSEVVVVCSCQDDPKLWLDVLEQGAYDVLVEPIQPKEAQRIVEAAAVKSDVRSHAEE